MYVIYSQSEDGFWSNEDGWVDLDSATCFTVAEARTLNLPMSADDDAHFTRLSEVITIHPTLAADLALAAAVRERFPNMTLAIEDDLAANHTLSPGDIDPESGRTVERVTGTSAEPVIVYEEED